jgi:aryl-alcohol dehydrogenase-like predicted oxidoreductase
MNKLVLGTVQMGLRYGVNNLIGQPPEEQSIIILQEAYKNGIRLLDTAEAYGSAHEIIGKYHLQNPNQNFRVITKISDKHDEKPIVEKIAHYLNQLRINDLEAILFHSFALYKKSKEQLDKLLHLKEKKIIKSIGVSLYTNEELEQVIDDININMIQLPFNLLDNFSVRGELLREAKKRGKIIHTRSAFLQGLFFKNIDDNHPIVRALKPQLARINEIARQEKISMTDLSLGYCLMQNEIDFVLIGVDSIQQLEQNIGSSMVILENETVAEINKIVTSDLDLLNPSLWK